MGMVKKAGVLACAVASLAIWGSTASAGGPPPNATPPPTGNGYCPDGFQWLPTTVLEGYSVGGIVSADLNRNGMTCIKFLNTPSDIVFFDDIAPIKP
jgi:hypothetical protein